MLDCTQDVQRAFLEEYGQHLDTASLVTGDGCVFEVQAAGDVIFDKEADEFDVDAIVESVGDRL